MLGLLQVSEMYENRAPICVPQHSALPIVYLALKTARSGQLFQSA
jgi:hypothetical protein